MRIRKEIRQVIPTVLRQDIGFANVLENDTQLLFHVVFNSGKENQYIERVTINEPFYRHKSYIAFMPIYRIGKIVYLTTPIIPINEESTIYKNDKNELVINVKNMTFGPAIRKMVNQVVSSEETAYGYTQDDINSIISMVESDNFESIPEITDFSNIYMFSTAALIIEAINEKIDAAAERAQYAGANKLMLESTIRDILNSRISQYVDRNIYDNGNHYLPFTISRKVILPQSISGRKPYNNRYFAMNHSPQSEWSGVVVHFRRDAEYDNVNHCPKSISDTAFPYSDIQATSPYIRQTYPNRQQVRMSITQSMLIKDKQEPLVYSSADKIYAESGYMPGSNFHCAFMHWGHTAEDGIIISESTADKLTAIRFKEELISCYGTFVPQIEAIKEDPKVIKSNFDSYWNENPASQLNASGIIGTADDQIIRTKNKVPSLVYAIENTGTQIEQVWINGEVVDVHKNIYYVKTIARIDMNLGDKLMGFYQGNKGTIAKIYKDKDMPSINGKKVEIVFVPEMAKRGIPIVHECIDSLKAKISGKQICRNPNDSIDLKFDDILPYGPLEFNGKVNKNTNVLHGFLRITRLDHNSREKLSYVGNKPFTQSGYKSGSIVFPGVTHVLYTAGCESALKEILENSSHYKPVLEEYLDILGLNIEDITGIEKGVSNVVQEIQTDVS